MQPCTNFRVGDIVNFKEDYFLLLRFENTDGDKWDVYTAVYLNAGITDKWSFSEEAFTKVA